MTAVLFARHPVDPEHLADFEGLIGEHLVQMRAAPGLLWADCARAISPPGGRDDPSVIVLSEWRTGADADAWESGDAVAGFDRAADALRRADPTRRRFVSA